MPATVDAQQFVLHRVSKVYPGNPDVQAVRDLSLTLLRGSYSAVMGPSGSGKSTLLHLLGLLDWPTSGQVLWLGQDTTSMSESERSALRARDIGFIFQSFHLLPYRSAQENVELGMLYSGLDRRSRTAAARQALDLVGLAERASALPAELSGGEQQRVAAARALAHAPSLLLCDEPTGNLDSANASVLLDILDRLHVEGLTLLMITHDPDVASRAEHLYRIRDGVLQS